MTRKPHRPYRILGVLDALSGRTGTYDLQKDTSHLLLLEFFRRGYEVYITAPSGLSIDSGKVFARAQKASVLETAPYFMLEATHQRLASDFKLILMRKDPPVDASYLQATQVLAAVPPSTWVCNAPQALAQWNEKLVILQFPRWIPPTAVTADEEALAAFARNQGGKIVLKSLTGFGGRGTHLVSVTTPDWKKSVAEATQDGQTPVMAQTFLPEISRGEKRIFLFDGRPLGALLRIPSPNSFLANPDLGARMEQTALTAREKKLCMALTPFLRKNGIFFAGVDVIDERLTEINITSPGMVWEWNEVDRAAHEREIVDLFEKKMAHR